MQATSSTTPDSVFDLNDALHLLRSLSQLPSDCSESNNQHFLIRQSLGRVWTWISSEKSCLPAFYNPLIEQLSFILKESETLLKAQVLQANDLLEIQAALETLSERSLRCAESLELNERDQEKRLVNDNESRSSSKRVHCSSSTVSLANENHGDKSLGLESSEQSPRSFSSCKAAYLKVSPREVAEVVKRYLPKTLTNSSTLADRCEAAIFHIFRQILENSFDSDTRYSKKQTRAPFTYRLIARRDHTILKMIIPKRKLGGGCRVNAIGSLSLTLPFQSSVESFTCRENATLRGRVDYIKKGCDRHRKIYETFSSVVPILPPPIAYHSHMSEGALCNNKTEAEMDLCTGTLFDASHRDLDTQLSRESVFRLSFSSYFQMLKAIPGFLAQFHEKGYIHGDVKAQNILVKFVQQDAIELFINDFDYTEKSGSAFSPKVTNYFPWDVCANLGFHTYHSDIVGFASILFTQLRDQIWDSNMCDLIEWKKLCGKLSSIDSASLKSEYPNQYASLCCEHLSSDDDFLPQKLLDQLREKGFNEDTRALLRTCIEEDSIKEINRPRARELLVEFFIFEKIFDLLSTILMADEMQKRHFQQLDREAQSYQGEDVYGSHTLEQLFNQLERKPDSARTQGDFHLIKRALSKEIYKRVKTVHQAARFPSLKSIQDQLQAIEDQAMLTLS